MNEQIAKQRAQRAQDCAEAPRACTTDRILGGADCAEAPRACTTDRILGGADCAGSPTIRTAIEVRADNPFEAALYALKQGHRVTRRGWNAGGQWVAMQRPDKHSKMSLPYLYIKTAQADMVPWHASQSDILSSDWAILPIQPI